MRWPLLFALLSAALAALFVLWLCASAARGVHRWHRTRRLHFEDAPRLHRLVGELSRAVRLPAPRLYRVEQGPPQAFCLGTSARRADLVLTRAALEELDPAHLGALLALEIAHLAHGHLLRSTLAAAGAVALMGGVRRWARLGARSPWRLGSQRADGQARAHFSPALRRLLVRLHRMGRPLARDLVADRTAAALAGCAASLAAALQRQQESLPREGTLGAADGGHALAAPALALWERAHIEERIRRLLQLAEAEQTRRERGIWLRPAHHPVRGTRFFHRPRARRPWRPRPSTRHPARPGMEERRMR